MSTATSKISPLVARTSLSLAEIVSSSAVASDRKNDYAVAEIRQRG
jgi:hypothetical protein